ncbi:MAG: bis(5'-nucleosyl)-tetraphosphatase (symmetrical) YqeK [Bacteroidaceae bacterium]|nr:bis(5'-nucleosyl)-tetraphosphatase (symmetrical) YqeK [Bacteroidaceae bacterium]
MKYDFNRLDKLAKKTLSKQRYYHTQCVVNQAEKLAEIYGCNKKQAKAAGWLHDICKEMPREEQLQWLTKYGIILDSVQKKQPKTWHGLAACGFCKFKLGIDDEELLNAIRYHTTACGNMSLLDEVVYLADLISADRTYPDIDKMRKLAQTNIEQAMKYALCYSLSDLIHHEREISHDSFAAYNYYIKF